MITFLGFCVKRQIKLHAQSHAWSKHTYGINSEWGAFDAKLRTSLATYIDSDLLAPNIHNSFMFSYSFVYF